jgi:hypothetical protein
MWAIHSRLFARRLSSTPRGVSVSEPMTGEIQRDVAQARRRLIAAVAALPEARLDERLWFTGPRTVGEALAYLVEHAREHHLEAMVELAAP